MAVAGLFKYAQRALFSKPSPERQLLKLIKGQPIRRVVEVGIQSVGSTESLLAALVKQSGEEAVHYTAIDPFEERSGGEPAPLMGVYQRFVATGARVRLIPGEPDSGIGAEANSLADTDLLLFSHAAHSESLERGWYYVPRMCHPGTAVFSRLIGDSEQGDPGSWEAIELSEILTRAQASDGVRAA